MGSSKPIVLVAAARDSRARAAVIADEKAKTVGPAFERVIAKSAHLMSDADGALIKIGQNFATHETVKHGKREFARGNLQSATADRLGGLLAHKARRF